MSFSSTPRSYSSQVWSPKSAASPSVVHDEVFVEVVITPQDDLILFANIAAVGIGLMRRPRMLPCWLDVSRKSQIFFFIYIVSWSSARQQLFLTHSLYTLDNLFQNNISTIRPLGCGRCDVDEHAKWWCANPYALAKPKLGESTLD